MGMMWLAFRKPCEAQGNNASFGKEGGKMASMRKILLAEIFAFAIALPEISMAASVNDPVVREYHDHAQQSCVDDYMEFQREDGDGVGEARRIALCACEKRELAKEDLAKQRRLWLALKSQSSIIGRGGKGISFEAAREIVSNYEALEAMERAARKRCEAKDGL